MVFCGFALANSLLTGIFLMKIISTIMSGLLLWLFTPTAIYACPGCGPANDGSGASNGIIAIYSILAGMPFLIIGSILVGFIIMKRKSSQKITEHTEEHSESNGGNEN